ncbi:MAG: anthranilate phosphoribosyltransferase [Candidatus Hadarchaeales archaeon]
MNPLQRAIARLVEFQHLTEEEAREAMRCIMSGEATPAQIGSFLTALRMKGETAEEIAALAKVMREFATRISPKVNGMLVDTCGTGGDRIKTFNISTAAMFVAAGAGVVVAKHGNRSVTSRAGSADVIEALGARIDLLPWEVERTIEKVGIGFMFAPSFHRAMKHAMGPRRELGLRTVFNLLGPLTNPAGAEAQVVGVYDAGLTEVLSLALARLGCKRAMVVHGLDGLDELSTLGATKVSELEDGEVRTYVIEPEELGIKRADPQAIAGSDAVGNAKVLLEVLLGRKGPKRDIVALNSAAAIAVSGRAHDLREGLEVAEEIIDSGKAYEKLVRFIEATGGDLERLRALEASL